MGFGVKKAYLGERLVGLVISSFTGVIPNGELYIPDEIDGWPVVKIGDSVFAEKGIKSVRLPNKLIEIERMAFFKNEIKRVVLPELVSRVGARAFSLNQLEELKLSKNLRRIDKSAFRGNKIRALKIPNEVWFVGEEAFSHNKIESLSLPRCENGCDTKILVVDTGAFKLNEIGELDLGNRLRRITSLSFSHNKLEFVYIPEGVTEVNKYSFFGNEIKYLHIPDSVDYGASKSLDWYFVQTIFGRKNSYGESLSKLMEKDFLPITDLEKVKRAIKIQVLYK